MPEFTYKTKSRSSSALTELGLTVGMVVGAVSYVDDILSSIDERLLDAGGERLSELVELANLSAIIGNLYRGGIVKFSEGKFRPNLPHTYPDLLASDSDASDIEIKVALENNKPKGHLIKPGPHLTIRYVLTHSDGRYERGKTMRGSIPRIWEVRVGVLDERHFNFSNTEGDSGKTAVINAAGISALQPVFIAPDFLPMSPRGKLYSEYLRTFQAA